MTVIDPEAARYLAPYLELLAELWQRTTRTALDAAAVPGQGDNPTRTPGSHADPTANGIPRPAHAGTPGDAWRAACRAEARAIQRRWAKLVALLYPEHAPNLLAEIQRGCRTPNGHLVPPSDMTGPSEYGRNREPRAATQNRRLTGAS